MKKYESMLLGAMGATLGIVLLQVLSETSKIALLVAPFGATFVSPTSQCFASHAIYFRNVEK